MSETAAGLFTHPVRVGCIAYKIALASFSSSYRVKANLIFRLNSRKHREKSERPAGDPTVIVTAI